jgi:TorA maturation chaperone TorD
VRDFLAQAGYVVLPESGELPDHISVELAFMSELAQREAEAARAGDRKTAECAASLQRRFMDEHLGRWAGCFAGEVRGAASTSFYRSMAALLAGFIANEHTDRTIQ